MGKCDDDFPVSKVLIHNSAGKLYSEQGNADKATHCFRQALLAAETPEMKTEISLNLANALSAKGDEKKAMEIYDMLLKTKSTKQTKLFFLALFNKSHLNYFETSLDAVEDGDVESLVVVKKHIGVTYFAVGQFDKAIASFEDALEALSDKEGKSTNLLKADIWNLMARVYKQKGNLPQAKNFAKLGKRVLSVFLRCRIFSSC
jgi:tetratricopeptide (TPR) repeat protein